MSRPAETSTDRGIVPCRNGSHQHTQGEDHTGRHDGWRQRCPSPGRLLNTPSWGQAGPSRQQMVRRVRVVLCFRMSVRCPLVDLFTLLCFEVRTSSHAQEEEQEFTSVPAA